jgi:hypothetical protein
LSLGKKWSGHGTDHSPPSGAKVANDGTAPPPFLTLELDGGEWSASHHWHLTFGERAPGIHWIGGWVGLWASLDAVEKRKILPLLGIQPQLIAHCYTERAYPSFTYVICRPIKKRKQIVVSWCVKVEDKPTVIGLAQTTDFRDGSVTV